MSSFYIVTRYEVSTVEADNAEEAIEIVADTGIADDVFWDAEPTA